MKIADIFASVQLNLETGEFEAKADKFADKTGQSMGGKMKKAVGAGLGAAVGLAAGVALVGAGQLDAAMRQLQADTGMTTAEAKDASKAMATLYSNNLQGFAEIGEAMAKVRTDLGLTGEAADKAAQAFLDFGTATGQEAASAVMAFDDILDAWNLTAEDATAVMDKLVVSHQMFGGTIEGSQAALAAMAPAMQAANMDIDDGIALLNLFNTAGVDASKAPAVLAKAVKQLKPGQDLDDLIAQVASIEDPTLRGQKAMELFGAKAGLGMAQAIKPGMLSLDELTASMGDTSGATLEASDAIKSSFGAQFDLMLKKAGGALAQFGSSFGPLLMVASQVGPGMLKGIAGGVGAFAGAFGPKLMRALLPKAAAAGAAAAAAEITTQAAGVAAGQATVAAKSMGPAALAGTRLGSAMGAAAGVAAAAAIGLGIALAFKSIVLDPGLQAQTKAIGTSIGEQVKTGTTEALLTSKAALETGIERIKALPFGEMLYGDQLAALNEQLTATTDEVTRRAEEMGAAVPTAVAAGAESTMPVWSGKVEEIVTFFGTTMAGVKGAALAAGADGMLAMAAGIASARKAPLDAFDSLKAMLKNAMTPQAEQLRLHGQLLSKTLAAGLKSGDPQVRAQAVATAKLIADRLGELTASGGKAGKDAMAALEKGIKSKNPDIAAASLAAKKAALANLSAAAAPAGTAGARAGGAFVREFKGKLEDDKLSVSWKVGYRPGGYAVGAWELPADQMAMVHRGEMIVPAAVASEVRAGTASIGGGAAAATGPTVNVYNPTPEPASTSVSRELRKLAYMGSVS